MPIKIPDGLPAIDILQTERIPLIRESRAVSQDIRPMRIALLNLMPDKISTETQLARVLGATPLQVELTLLRTSSYVGKNTAEEHLLGYYKTWEDVKDEKFDGFIMTGAPVELMPFEEVTYWEELTQILDWTKTHTYSQFFICWGAQAAIYHFNQVQKRETGPKQFGVYTHKRLDFYHPLTRGFNDDVDIPVSRYTESDVEAVRKSPDLQPLLEADETGLSLIYDEAHRRAYMFNHLEYDRDTLKNEYERDIAKGVDTAMPHNYFPDNDPTKEPIVNWRSHRNLLFGNWLNLVYQGTPYNLDDLPI